MSDWLVPVLIVWIAGSIFTFCLFAIDALNESLPQKNRQRDARIALLAYLWPLMLCVAIKNTMATLRKAARS